MIVIPAYTRLLNLCRAYQGPREIHTMDEYRQVLRQGRPVLLFFGADWCQPCQMLTPSIQRIAVKHSDDLTVLKVKVDNEELIELVRHFKASRIPMLAFIREGKMGMRYTGMLDDSQAEKFVQKGLQSLI